MEKIIVSAGDAITAKLVEEAGFDGVWVSGFEVSARMGLPDNGSLTMIEMVNICKPIVEAVDIPVYVDVDTGYNNFKRTAKEFEKIGIRGICVEDNLPNKENSLWGGKCNLLPINEFLNKITIRGNIEIIARTEALIRGYGMKEAIKRLTIYSKVADYVLPHTRDEKLICKENFRVPKVTIPTKFPHYTNKRLFNMGYSMVIWANQTERVKIKSIREALRILKKDDCAKNIENKLSTTLEDMRGLCPLS